MPLVDTTTLLRVADRAAYQYGQLKATMTAIRAVGLGYYWQTITATDDPDVEIPCEAVYRLTDDDLLTDFAARNGTLLANIIGGMESHFSSKNPATGMPFQVGGWDGYLFTQNKRVSQYFAELFYACRGYYMLAVDVFSEGVDTFGTALAMPPINVIFTDGVNYGNGANTNPANGTYFAATQLKAYVESMGPANLDLRLYVKDVNNNPVTIDVTIPNTSPPGTEIAIGTTSDRFLDVTNVTFKPGGSDGTIGDRVKIRNIKERTIAL